MNWKSWKLWAVIALIILLLVAVVLYFTVPSVSQVIGGVFTGLILGYLVSYFMDKE